MTDIYELRKLIDKQREYRLIESTGHKLLSEAANEIDKLRAEAAELRRHIEALRGYKAAAQKLIDELTRERDEARRWARKFYKLYNDSIAADIMSREDLLRDVMKMWGKRPNWPK